MPDMRREHAFIERKDLLPMLRNHHVFGLDHLQQHILAARCSGGETAPLAALFDYSVGQFANRFRAIEDIALAPLGLARNLAILTLWFGEHLSCEKHCISHAEMLVEKRIVFARV